MMGGKCLTDAEKAAIRGAYIEQGTIAAACRASGRSAQVVTDYLVRVKLHRPGHVIRKPDSILAARNEEIYRLYREHVRAKAIAKQFGIGKELVYYVTNKMRLQRGEASI